MKTGNKSTSRKSATVAKKSTPTKGKSEGMITINLREVASEETIAKLFKLCKERGLPFPNGIISLIEEVSEPPRVTAAVKKASVKASKTSDKMASIKSKKHSATSANTKKVSTRSKKTKTSVTAKKAR